MKFGRNGDPVVPARYDDPLSNSIYYNGKAYSTTPARATDEEIEDDLAQMRKTWDGKPYVKPASPEEVLPEFDNYGYKGRVIKKPKSKLESNIRNEPPTGEELVNRSQPKDEEAGVSIETSDTRDEPLNTNERFWGCKFRGEEEYSVTMSDTRYKTFQGEEVFQPNQAPREEGSSFAKPNAPRVPFMKKVVQDSQFKAKEAEPLLEACNARDEPLAMKEVFQDIQLKDKEVESSVAPDTPTTLAPINCAVDTGAPATSRKRKISEISELTNSPLTSPLDGQMPQTENEEGPPHKKLRTANGAVNLPIPPEKPATPQKAIPARAKRTATRKARCAGGGRVGKRARVGKASGVVDKSVAKAAPPAIPAGEPAIVAKSVAVVVVTRASSRGVIRNDESPTATAPEAEGPIREIIADQDDKSSTSSESGDDLKDGSYAPIAPRKRRVVGKGKAPVAPRKRAAPNKAIASNEEKTPAQQGDKPSAAIPQVFTGPEIASTKPIAVSRSHGVKRKATGLEDEIAIQQEAGPPVAPEADAALITENPAPVPPRRYVRRNATAPKDAIIKPRTTPEVDTALGTETDKPAPRPRKRARKEVNIPEDGAIVREWVQRLACPEADAAQKTQRPDRIPTRRPRRRNDTAQEEVITRATTTPAEIGTALAKENPKPAAGPKESGRRNGKAPETEATAQKEAEPLVAPGADAALIIENPAPAPPRRYVRRKAAAPEEAITRATTTSAVIDTALTKENAKPAAGPKRRGRRNGNAPEAEATAQKEAVPLAAPDVDAALATEKPTPAPPRRYVRRKATAPEEAITRTTTAPAEIGTTLTKENVKPAAGPKRRGRRNGNALEAKATAQKEAGPPAAPDVDAAPTTEKPTPAPLGGYAKRKATVLEAATGPPIVPKVSTTLAETANTSQRWRRNVGAHAVKVVTHPDTSLKIDNTKPSAATKSRGVKRKATQLEDKAANIPKADAALAQGSDEPATGPREHKKKRVDTPEARAAVPQEAGPSAAPEVDSTLTTEKPNPAPTADSFRGGIAVPEEHAPPAAASETPVGAVEAATQATTLAPPVRVRGPRYRIPAEGSRKSTRIKAQHDKLK